MAGVIDRPVFPLGLTDPFRLNGTGLSDTVSFGSGSVDARIELGGSALLDTPNLGDGSITIGPVLLAGTGLADGVSFGTGSVVVGGVDVVDDEIDTFTPTFGTGSVNPGPVDLAGTGLSDQVTFGLGETTIGGISVLDDEDDVFTPALGTGAVVPTYAITGTGLTDAVSLGSGSIFTGPVSLDGYGIPPDPRVGRGTVVPTHYYFVGPTLRYGHGRRNSPLWWVENAEGITLLRESGVWREALCPTGDEIAAADRAYRGGYRTPLTGDQKNELVAAGYGAYIEED